jgi:hypothetical protein
VKTFGVSGLDMLLIEVGEHWINPALITWIKDDSDETGQHTNVHFADGNNLIFKMSPLEFVEIMRTGISSIL